MDHRIGPYFLNASVGFGGSCFQKDILNLVYLCKHFGLDEVGEYWHQVLKINQYQKNRFANRIIEDLDKNLYKKEVIILGWAFKCNTNDSRESASIYVSEKLYNSGINISIYDPMVSRENIVNDIEQYWKEGITLKNETRIKILKDFNIDFGYFDAVAILTEWDQFKKFNFEGTKVYDGRNILVDTHYSIGR